MAKDTKNTGPLKPGVNVSIPREIHAKFKAFAGAEYDLGFATSAVLAWFLEQDAAFQLVLMNRRRMGSDRMRAAFCAAMQSLTSEVCNKPDGIARQTLGVVMPENGGGGGPAASPSRRQPAGR